MPGVPSCSTIPPAALILGLAGVLPFAAAAVAQTGRLELLSPSEGLRLGVTYGAVILSFLGGIRWGAALPAGRGNQTRDFSASVVPSLAGVAALLLPDGLATSLLIAGFLMQALWDVLTVESGRLPPWFGKLRMILTAGAVASLMVLLLRLLM